LVFRSLEKGRGGRERINSLIFDSEEAEPVIISTFPLFFREQGAVIDIAMFDFGRKVKFI
jgi:hypothetical protein